MTAPSRIRVLTPEQLDAKAAALVNTPGTQLATAVASKAGSSSGTATGVTTATANTLVGRDANARTQFADPAVPADAATKHYVDTTIAGYVPSTQLGAASGVATLDGSGFVTTGQVPQFLHRHLGSGTAYPASPRQGDTFIRTDLGGSGVALMRYNGTAWRQAERPEMTIAERRALVTASLHRGFEVIETDQPASSSFMRVAGDSRVLRWDGAKWRLTRKEIAEWDLEAMSGVNPGYSVVGWNALCGPMSIPADGVYRECLLRAGTDVVAGNGEIRINWYNTGSAASVYFPNATGYILQPGGAGREVAGHIQGYQNWDCTVAITVYFEGGLQSTANGGVNFPIPTLAIEAV